MELEKKSYPVLFIGEERICKQVAYVLDFNDYLIKDFTWFESVTENLSNYVIYVCQFRSRCSKQFRRKAKQFENLKYLDDICRDIDHEYYLNRQRSIKKLRAQLKEISFLPRVKLYIYEFLKSRYCKLKWRKILCNAKKLNYSKIKMGEVRALRCLKPSYLFLYVLNAPVNKNIKCSLMEMGMYISDLGDVRGCCSAEIPYGNMLLDGDLDNIYHSRYARIVKLSSLNHSYCLCDLGGWCPYYTTNENNDFNLKKIKPPKYPETINISIDRTCNLCCKSCRNEFYVKNDIDKKKLEIISDNILASGYLEKTQELIIAGQGEVFYSPYYRKLIDGKLKRKYIHILSNGTLFNKENWNLIKDKYETIDVMISVDAATAETYKNLRGGNFNILMNNLRMISELHKQGKIRCWNLNYVVQRDNFREMPSFVRLAKSLGVDSIGFQKMLNFRNLSEKEYLEKSLVIDDEYLNYELYQVLQDPIFQDPIVDLRGFKRYILASNSRYGNK